MADFGTLFVPREIFWDILAYTPKECLPSFAQVSKTWNATVTPILYERIDLTWRRTRYICHQGYADSHPDVCPCENYHGHCNPDRHKHEDRWPSRLRTCLQKVYCQAEECNFPKLYMLVRTVVYSPVLASHVRQLRLRGAVPPSVWTDPQRTGLTNEDRAQIQRILRVGRPFQCPDITWITELDKGSPSAFAALLLMRLGNLQELEIGADFKQPLSYIGSISTLQQRLRSLTTVTIGTFREKVYMAHNRAPLPRTANLDSLLLLHLSSLRHLSLNLPKPLKDDTFKWPDRDMMPLAMNLESLELSFTFLNEHDLSHLLAACPRLKIFKYDFWTLARNNADPSDALVDLSALEMALLLVKATLESFHLHIENYNWAAGSWNDDFEHLSGRISFKDFPRLATLHVPLQVLVGARDVMRKPEYGLPETLTHLWLNNDGYDFQEEDMPGAHPQYSDEEYIKIILDYLAHWKEFTPSLRALKLLVYQVPYLDWFQWDPEVLADVLEPRGTEVGLNVSVIMLPWRAVRDPCPRVGLRSQGPPYFDLDVVERSRLLEKGPNQHTHRASFFPEEEARSDILIRRYGITRDIS